MYKLFLFAGTSEGHYLADRLKDTGIPTCVFTATDYGKSLLSESGSLTVQSGRLTEEEMTQVLAEKGEGDAWVIDATHPYAAVVTENIRSAAAASGKRYIRVLRESGAAEAASSSYCDDSSVIYVKSTEEAASFLAGTTGNILLTTGSKELAVFTSIPNYKERVFARVLSLAKVAVSCAELGFEGKNLICMQGPFSEEMNRALIHQTGAVYLVTKDTGREGGFPEKEAAAAACGCRLVIIGRPLDEEGISPDQCLLEIQKENGDQK